MQFQLILQAIVAVAPLIVDLVKYISDAKKRGWINDANDLRKQIQVTTDKGKRMDLAQYLSERSPK
jgi:predicted transcriptional regulator